MRNNVMKAIVAMDPCRVIGYHGGIPWHYKEDMQWFKQFTTGQTLLMGWNTYHSLPVRLKGRQIVVLSKTWHPSMALNHEQKADAVYFRYPPDHKVPYVMDVFHPEDWPNIIVAGGAKTYSLLMPHVSEMYVTHLADEYEGDTYMPEFEYLFPESSIVRENKDFLVVKYTRTITPYESNNHPIETNSRL